MPLFHFIGHDKPDGLAVRMAARPEHLAYAQPHTRAGGALLGADGNPIGSVIILEADSLEAAQALIDNDPYTKAGVFETTELHPWRLALGGIVGYTA